MPIRHPSGRSDISGDRGCTSPGSCPSTLEAPSNQKSRRRPSNPSDSKESRSLRTDTKRDRVLTDDELRAFWKASEAWEHPFSRLLRFILLTATRRQEAA